MDLLRQGHLYVGTEIEFNEDRKVCAECKGQCCRIKPGMFIPEDFVHCENESTHLINLGIAQVDYDERILNKSDNEWDIKITYYVRPKRSSDTGIFDRSSMPGICIHYGEGGCRLDWKYRPAECRGLVPSKNKCYPTIPVEELVNSWDEHQDWLRGLIHKF